MMAPLAAQGLSPAEQRLVAAIDAGREGAVDRLARAVNIRSATENHEGVRRVGDLYAAELTAMGFEARWVDQSAIGRAGHLVAEHRGTKGTRILLIGHLDTVLQAEPFRREGQRAYGSGIADMKSGNGIALEALRALNAAGRLRGPPGHRRVHR